MQEEAQFVFGILACFLAVGMIVSYAKGLFSPYFIFFSFLLVGIVIRGVYLLDESAFDATDFWSRAAPLVQGDFLPAYLELIAAIGIAVATSRILVRIRNPMEEAFLRFFSFKSEEIHFSVTMAAAVFSCLAFLAALATSQGGLLEGFTSLQKRALVFGSEVFVIRILAVVFSVTVALLVYKVSVECRSSGRIRKAGVISAVLMNFALLLLSGGRGPVMTQMVVLLYVRNRGLNRGNLTFKTTALIAGVGSFVLVAGMALRRSAQLGTDLSESAVDSIKTAGHTVSGAFPITDLYLAARHFANSSGHDYGMQFLLYLVRFIPRSLWAEKPLNLGYSMREFYYGDMLSGVIPTLFGEFYIAWGFIGIIACGIFLGWMLSFLHRAYRHAQRDSAHALIYVLLATVLLFDGLRAGLEQAVFMILYLLLTLTGFKIAARLKGVSAGKRLQCGVNADYSRPISNKN